MFAGNKDFFCTQYTQSFKGKSDLQNFVLPSRGRMMYQLVPWVPIASSSTVIVVNNSKLERIRRQ